MTVRSKNASLEFDRADLEKGDGDPKVEMLTADNGRLRLENESLRDTLRLAESTTQTKAAFLANVSHEMRTPLNGVIGMTELLLDSELRSEQRELANTALSSARSLLSIINEVLKLSKMDSGELNLSREEFSPRDAIGKVVSMMARFASSKGLSLVSEIDDKVPQLLCGDPHRMTQLLQHLLSNAVKFTDRGFVWVRVRESGSGDGDPGKVRLRVEVEDTGIGIAAEYMDRLFHRFSQADNSTTRKFGEEPAWASLSTRSCVN